MEGGSLFHRKKVLVLDEEKGVGSKPVKLRSLPSMWVFYFLSATETLNFIILSLSSVVCSPGESVSRKGETDRNYTLASGFIFSIGDQFVSL